MKDVLTVRDVAAELGVSDREVEDLIEARLIIAIQPLAGGPVRIPTPALAAYRRRIGLRPPARMRPIDDIDDLRVRDR